MTNQAMRIAVTLVWVVVAAILFGIVMETGNGVLY